MPDDVYAEAAAHFDEQELAHVLALILTINTWNRVALATAKVAGTDELSVPLTPGPAQRHRQGSGGPAGEAALDRVLSVGLFPDGSRDQAAACRMRSATAAGCET